MPYALITAGEKLPEQALLAQVFAAALGQDRDTAALSARRCRGVFGLALDGAAAAAVEAACAQLGAGVLKLDTAALPALPPPAQAKKAAFEGGSAVFTAGGAAVTAGPADIAVLAAGPVRQEVTRTVKTTEGPSSGEKAVRLGIMAVTGLPIGLGKSKEVNKEIKGSDLSFYLDITLAGGARLRVHSDDFDFSCLKEKKTYSSQVNFRLLCLELAAFAPGAWKSSALLGMIEGRPLALLAYDSLEELEKETLRLYAARGRHD